MEGVPAWSLDLTFYALPRLFLPSASQTMRRKPYFEAKNVPLLENEGVLKLETPRVASLKRRRFSRPS